MTDDDERTLQVLEGVANELPTAADMPELQRRGFVGLDKWWEYELTPAGHWELDRLRKKLNNAIAGLTGEGG